MPRYGFNFLWMYVWHPEARPQPPDEHALDFMAAFGFDFVRIPTDYRFWTRDFAYFQPDESVFAYFDRYLDACRARGFHMSLNLHRAPGYCINRNDLERHNLWKDQVAQDAFVFIWETLARRYRGVPGELLSFDLLNEPPNVGQYGLTRAQHAALIRRAVAAIRAIDPARDRDRRAGWRAPGDAGAGRPGRDSQRPRLSADAGESPSRDVVVRP